MGTALYIVAEQPVSGVEDFVHGRALAQVDEVELEELCNRLKIASLWAFVSQNPADFAEFLEPDEIDAVPIQAWFDPAEGLTSVRALHGHLVTHPQALSNAAALIDDLQDYEWALAALEELGTRWHFALAPDVEPV